MIVLVKIYRTDDRKIHEEEELTEGVWVQMVNPSEGEGEEYARKLDVDITDLLAALDEEESSRIELEDGYTLILVDIPTTEIRMDKEAYTTIPLGHHSDEGCDHYGVYRGYTCASVLCARQS